MAQTGMTGMIVSRDPGGIELGVLEDGTPFLTGSGLARACGVPRGVIYERAADWAAGKRDGKLARLLVDAGFTGESLYVPITWQGSKAHAYPDSICTIFLEYYALDNSNPTATQNYRVLARQGLRSYIYRQLNYDPARALPAKWRDFHDRLMLNRPPTGYFSVYREMTEFLVRAIQAGFVMDAHTVPDGSVGLTWAAHWNANGFAAKYGERLKFEHHYPDYYPQSRSNPQDAAAYPIVALGEFRLWLDNEYLPKKFPKYIRGKASQLGMDAAAVTQLLTAVLPEALPSGEQ